MLADGTPLPLAWFLYQAYFYPWPGSYTRPTFTLGLVPVPGLLLVGCWEHIAAGVFVHLGLERIAVFDRHSAFGGRTGGDFVH
jgi:hypothetical protein